ncbi:MAG: hypothetical protein RL693_1593 [Verrucomicrobiota bacterium]|jgi:hypothetical protein
MNYQRLIIALFIGIGAWVHLEGRSLGQNAVGNFQIIEQQIVHKDGRAITFNRVVPPPTPIASASTSVSPSKVANVPLEQESKDHQMLSISATVYDRKITELRWFKDGKSFHAWSNIDFNYIAGIGSFETADTIYSVVLGIGNETSQSSGIVKSLPALEAFPAAQSSYILIKGDPKTAYTAQDVASMDALHHYFAVNRDKLKAAYTLREQERLKQEQWQKAHPPVPKDTVINFWPIKSSVYLGKGESK